MTGRGPRGDEQDPTSTREMTERRPRRKDEREMTPTGLDSNHRREIRQRGRNENEFRGIIFPISIGGLLGKAKKDEKINNTQLPKLAPLFDGLNSFETLVSH